MLTINKFNKGFTLIELIIAMAILVVIAVILLTTLNSGAQVDKGYDAKRKKDINRIKVAFEEYFNDKGCYPNNLTSPGLVDELMDRANCSKSVFKPWLSDWPCDPNGNPYMLAFEMTSCPHWFKVLTKLQYDEDADIPTVIKENGDMARLGSGDRIYTRLEANFGVSSTNVLWYEAVVPEQCLPMNCYLLNGGNCNSTLIAGNDYSTCSGPDCYSAQCVPQCQTYFCDSRLVNQ